MNKMEDNIEFLRVELEQYKNRCKMLEYECDEHKQEYYYLKDEIKNSNIYPRDEITIPDLMKFEFLKENWDKISLEKLELSLYL